MIAYASRTGTRRNLDALRRAGWRLMVSARGALRTEGFRYALDNGAWTSFQRGEPFDEAAFERAIARLGADADWIVVPDIVMGGMASLKFSRSWLARLRNRRALAKARFMVAVQNGIMPAHVRDLGGAARRGLHRWRYRMEAGDDGGLGTVRTRARRNMSCWPGQ